MMRARILLFSVIIASLLANCILVARAPTKQEGTATWAVTQVMAVVSPPREVTSPTLTSTAVPSVTSTGGIAPTPTETATLGVSPTSTPDVGLKRQCLEIRSSVPSEVRVEGEVLLNDAKRLTPPYLFEIANERKVALPENWAHDQIWDSAVSPNRKWLAYRDMNSSGDVSRLVIISADGQPHYTKSWDPSWYLIAAWLGDDHLLISRQRGSDLYDSLVVLEPFTGKIKELVPNYPGMFYPSFGPDWGGFSRSKTVYDPTLSYVVYPGRTDEGVDLLFLWNMKAQRVAGVLTGTVSVSVTPLWSPNGKLVIVTGPPALTSSSSKTESAQKEFFSISLDGTVERLTDLADTYSEVKFGPYAWSPDGRYIAFRLEAQPNSYPDLYPTIKPKEPGRLAILDTVNREVTDYCLPARSLEPPVWSPDGRQLVLEDYNKLNGSDVYFVDLAKDLAVRIVNQFIPTGWMTFQP